MLQASSGRSGKQEQQQNSTNLGTTFEPILQPAAATGVRGRGNHIAPRHVPTAKPAACIPFLRVLRPRVTACLTLPVIVQRHATNTPHSIIRKIIGAYRAWRSKFPKKGIGCVNLLGLWPLRVLRQFTKVVETVETYKTWGKTSY